MKIYKNFLLEEKKKKELLKGSRIINKDELLYLLETDYSDFNINDNPIYREVKIFNKLNIYLDDPSQRERFSIHNKNYYNLLLDACLDLPKRSKSLIGMYKGYYLGQTRFRLIPKNGAIFGVLNTPDIWNLFIETTNLSTLENFSIQFQEITKIFDFIFNGEYDKNQNDLIKNINKIDINFINKYSNHQEFFLRHFKILFEELIENSKKNNTTNFDELKKKIKNVDITKKTYKTLIKDKRPNYKYEVWTDSECILIDPGYLNKLLNN